MAEDFQAVCQAFSLHRPFLGTWYAHGLRTWNPHIILIETTGASEEVSAQIFANIWALSPSLE